MKKLILITFAFLGLSASAQDTTDIYVINNTNRLVEITKMDITSYSFFYRDLKYVKTIRELSFDNNEELEKFFDQAEKVLATDVGVMTAKYNLSRNKLSKTTLKLRNKEDGYVMISRETLEIMRSEYQKSLNN